MAELTRRLILVELLRSYNDVVQNSWGQRTGGQGDGPLLMPPEYHEGSYRELEATLRLMRASNFPQYQALSERYIRARRLPRHVRRNRDGHWFQRENIALRKDISDHLNQQVNGRKRETISEHLRIVEFWAPVWASDVDLGLWELERRFPCRPRLPRVFAERLAA